MTGTANADANMALKKCLTLNGYSQEKFDSFDFSEAASCFQDWRSGEFQKELEKTRAFLKKNPWYKGKNWQWETIESAKYNCVVYKPVGDIVCKRPRF